LPLPLSLSLSLPLSPPLPPLLSSVFCLLSPFLPLPLALSLSLSLALSLSLPPCRLPSPPSPPLSLSLSPFLPLCILQLLYFTHATSTQHLFLCLSLRLFSLFHSVFLSVLCFTMLLFLCKSCCELCLSETEGERERGGEMAERERAGERERGGGAV